jgi:hypothetical protein
MVADAGDVRDSSTTLLALLAQERLCLSCLAGKVGRRPDDVARGLEELRATVKLSQQPALCANCLSVRISYRVQAAAG